MKKTSLLLSAFLLASCNGPWNMMGDDFGPSEPKLWVSHFAVADLPFDTLWLERPQSLTGSYDSTAIFVDTAATRILAIREDLPDTIEFRPMAGSGVAWLPTRTAIVARGGTYRLAAKVRWTTANGETRTDSLSATTHVPRIYKLFDYALAPMEAIAPWAMGLSGIDAATTEQKSVLDSLGATDATLDSMRRNLPVYRAVQREDTVWYLHDETRVMDISGVELQRAYRNYVFAQQMRREDWAGVLGVETFDTTRSYIINIVENQIQGSLGSSFDSARFYQKGNSRTLQIEGGYNPGQNLPGALSGILDTLKRFTGDDIQPWLLSNALLGYTGRVVIRTYALDRNHYDYYQRLANASSANSLRWSGVAGGDGYFSSAAVDSFPLFVRASRDTLSVPALHAHWCRKQKEKAKKDGKPWNPGSICAGF